MSITQKEPKHVYRLPPCPAYDIEKMESWLADMAKKGLLLSRNGFFAGFAIFEKTEPRFTRYRMEAAPKNVSMWSDNNGEPTEEAKELNESYGWQYVTSRAQFYIYRSDSPDARELNTDPRVQALALDLVRKRERSNIITSFLWLIIYPIIMLQGKLMLTAVNVGSWLIGWGMFLALWALARSVLRVVHLRKIRKKLALGEMLNHQKNWRQKISRYHLSGIMFLLLILVWIGCLFNGWSNEIMETNKQAIEDYSGNLPFATIVDFAPNGTYILNDIKYSNTIETNSDWLAPTIIEYHENATVTLENGRYLKGGLFVNYYETVAPWIAREIAREYKVEGKRSKDYEEYDSIDLDVDYAVAYFKVFPTVIVQKGNKVIKATFYQTSGSYKMEVNEWAQIIADSLK